MPDSDGNDIDVQEREAISTADQIVEAALQILGRDGLQKLTARSVASEAGTNLALINYYFGGKQGLLLAVYDALERQRFQRQAEMYAARHEPLSVKWRQAVEFYRQDLADGFVRIHHELLVQGLSNEKLAERARERIGSWNEMLTEVAEQYLPDIDMNVPLSMLIPALTAFWYGMEQQHLIGVPEEQAPYFEMLDLIGEWIAEQERQAEPRGE